MNNKLITSICIALLSTTLISCQTNHSKDKKETVNAILNQNTKLEDNSKESTNLESNNEVTTDDKNNNSNIITIQNKESDSVNTYPSKVASESKTVTRDCRIYFYHINDLKTYYVDTKVSVTDNAFVTALTSKLQESPNNNNNLLAIPNDYGVVSATINDESGILDVVFNNDFTKDMNIDNSVKSRIISAIVNTYAYNYGINKVAIYFGNTMYTDSNSAEQGYFEPSFDDTIPLN